ncbi:MAG: TetR/AcrR family transcriptional regulator [Eubacterium sp.]|nr:TetR/AcrR family transcriptional regulator [Eubacterium sp.]
MQDEKKTREKLLESAREEFIEKGYMKASLRSICKNAGVTTGALYFFFKDKDDLFGNVIAGPLSELKGSIMAHFYSEKEEVEIGINNMAHLDDDLDAAYAIISCLFKNKEIFELLLSGSQGSSYENIIDSFVDMLNEHYLIMFSRMKGCESSDELSPEDRFFVHWVSHDQIEIFLHILSHCNSEEEGRIMMKGLLKYMVGGWYAVVRGIT